MFAAPDGLVDWFADGQINTCWNALDRHVRAGRGAQTALIHDSPITESLRRISYADLQERVALLAGALQARGRARPMSLTISTSWTPPLPPAQARPKSAGPMPFKPCGWRASWPGFISLARIWWRSLRPLTPQAAQPSWLSLSCLKSYAPWCKQHRVSPKQRDRRGPHRGVPR